MADGEKRKDLFLNLVELQLAPLILALMMLALPVSQHTREKDRTVKGNMSTIAKRKLLLRQLFKARESNFTVTAAIKRAVLSLCQKLYLRAAICCCW